MKRICTDYGHSFGRFTYESMRCSVSKSVRTYYSTGRTETRCKNCDDVNRNGECSKFILKVGPANKMIRWWQEWWNKKKVRRSQ